MREMREIKVFGEVKDPGGGWEGRGGEGGMGLCGGDRGGDGRVRVAGKNWIVSIKHPFVCKTVQTNRSIFFLSPSNSARFFFIIHQKFG